MSKGTVMGSTTSRTSHAFKEGFVDPKSNKKNGFKSNSSVTPATANVRTGRCGGCSR